jgi:hypothetical protein
VAERRVDQLVQRVPLAVAGVRLDDNGAGGFRARGGCGVVDRAAERLGGDLGDLVAVDEAAAAVRSDEDTSKRSSEAIASTFPKVPTWAPDEESNGTARVAPR